MDPSNLIQLLQNRAQAHPDKLLFTFLEDGELQERSVRYGEFERGVRDIAALLQAHGLEGERVVLLYPPGLEYIAGFYGCLYGGVIAVPAYPPDPNRLNRTLPRLQAIIKDCQAKAILTTEQIRSMAEFLFAQAPDLAKLQWIATDSLPASLTPWRKPEVSSDSLAFLQYTSGSTGNPKGVMLTHGNLLHNMSMVQNGFAVGSKEVAVFWLPPYHDMGLIGGILETVFVSCSTVLMSPLAFLQRPFRWLQALSRYHGTTSGGPNFAYELCVRKTTPEQMASLDLSHWSLAFCGAEPIHHETLERFAKTFEPCGFSPKAFYPCYGLAEGTLIVTGPKRGNPLSVKRVVRKNLQSNEIVETGPASVESITLVGCGKTLADQEVLVVRPDNHAPCAPGQIGEIWVKGLSVARGYWNQPETTEWSFQARLASGEEDCYLRTGDLGFEKDGELYVTGRLKDLILIRGTNHYPQDIEATVERSHPAFRKGCVAAFSVEANFEEALVVVQEVDGLAENMIPSIRQAVAEHHDLQVHAVALIKKGSIPKTSSGKIRRHACREEFLTGKLEILEQQRLSHEDKIPSLRVASEGAERRTANSSRPNSSRDIEAWLIRELSERLGVSPKDIDVRHPVALYGLDSKEAVNLSGELEDWLGRSLSPTLLWKYPTIETLAQYLAGDEGILQTSLP